ncbi:MAG: aldo/keto reductase [Phycisphaerales bacterium]|nr:MAG: aldo/keto reductase [Phycisphaerales bacterium]
MKPFDHNAELSRRDFVKVGVASAAAAGISLPARAQDEQGEALKPSEPLPARVLGRTKEKVTILNLGAGRAPDARMLNAAYEAGIRFIDTASGYANGESERNIAQWCQDTGNGKEMCIVTKHPSASPEEWVSNVDERLEALKTDVIDVYFVHSIGDKREGSDDEGIEWPKMKEWAQAADKLKKSGKVRFVGFSCHSDMSKRVPILMNAVEGGWVDAVLVAYDPLSAKENAEFNKALDACYKAGIGLISMKEMRSVTAADVPKFMPDFKEMGLTPPQAVLHACWSDERLVSVCSDMPNLRLLQENAEAARRFVKPLDEKQSAAVLDLYRRHGRRYCAACDGSCRRAAGTGADLNTLARAWSYYEQDGCLGEARKLYASLSPEERNWHGADLAAATQACKSHLDFAAILPRVDQKLA